MAALVFDMNVEFTFKWLLCIARPTSGVEK